MLTHATTILDACSSPHPEVVAWIDAHTSTVRMEQVILVTVDDTGVASVTPTRWKHNARSGNAAHPLTGHGTYHLTRWTPGQYGAAMGSVQASHKVHIVDAAALAADWTAIGETAKHIHAMLFVAPREV